MTLWYHTQTQGMPWPDWTRIPCLWLDYYRAFSEGVSKARDMDDGHEAAVAALLADAGYRQ